MIPGRCWCTPTDAPAMMVAHRLLSSVMRSSDDSDWPVHSLMLSFHHLRGLPLRRLPSTVPCIMVFGSALYQQTWLNYDNLRLLTVRTPDIRQGRWPVSVYIRFFCVATSYAYFFGWVKSQNSPIFNGFSFLLLAPSEFAHASDSLCWFWTRYKLFHCIALNYIQSRMAIIVESAVEAMYLYLGIIIYAKHLPVAFIFKGLDLYQFHMFRHHEYVRRWPLMRFTSRELIAARRSGSFWSGICHRILVGRAVTLLEPAK